MSEPTHPISRDVFSETPDSDGYHSAPGAKFESVDVAKIDGPDDSKYEVVLMFTGRFRLVSIPTEPVVRVVSTATSWRPTGDGNCVPVLSMTTEATTTPRWRVDAEYKLQLRVADPTDDDLIRVERADVANAVKGFVAAHPVDRSRAADLIRRLHANPDFLDPSSLFLDTGWDPLGITVGEPETADPETTETVTDPVGMPCADIEAELDERRRSRLQLVLDGVERAEEDLAEATANPETSDSWMELVVEGSHESQWRLDTFNELFSEATDSTAFAAIDAATDLELFDEPPGIEPPVVPAAGPSAGTVRGRVDLLMQHLLTRLSLIHHRMGQLLPIDRTAAQNEELDALALAADQTASRLRWAGDLRTWVIGEYDAPITPPQLDWFGGDAAPKPRAAEVTVNHIPELLGGAGWIVWITIDGETSSVRVPDWVSDLEGSLRGPVFEGWLERETGVRIDAGDGAYPIPGSPADEQGDGRDIFEPLRFDGQQVGAPMAPVLPPLDETALAAAGGCFAPSWKAVLATFVILGLIAAFVIAALDGGDGAVDSANTEPTDPPEDTDPVDGERDGDETDGGDDPDVVADGDGTTDPPADDVAASDTTDDDTSDDDTGTGGDEDPPADPDADVAATDGSDAAPDMPDRSMFAYDSDATVWGFMESGIALLADVPADESATFAVSHASVVQFSGSVFDVAGDGFTAADDFVGPTVPPAMLYGGYGLYNPDTGMLGRVVPPSTPEFLSQAGNLIMVTAEVTGGCEGAELFGPPSPRPTLSEHELGIWYQDPGLPAIPPLELDVPSNMGFSTATAQTWTIGSTFFSTESRYLTNSAADPIPQLYGPAHLHWQATYDDRTFVGTVLEDRGLDLYFVTSCSTDPVDPGAYQWWYQPVPSEREIADDLEWWARTRRQF